MRLKYHRYFKSHVTENDEVFVIVNGLTHMYMFCDGVEIYHKPVANARNLNNSLYISNTNYLHTKDGKRIISQYNENHIHYLYVLENDIGISIEGYARKESISINDNKSNGTDYVFANYVRGKLRKFGIIINNVSIFHVSYDKNGNIGKKIRFKLSMNKIHEHYLKLRGN